MLWFLWLGGRSIYRVCDSRQNWPKGVSSSVEAQVIVFDQFGDGINVDFDQTESPFGPTTETSTKLSPPH